MTMNMLTACRSTSSPHNNSNLKDYVFSWSLADAVNTNLYKQHVTEIPMTFSSPHDYLNSFKPAIVEETHADVLSSLNSISSAPCCLFTSIHSVAPPQLHQQRNSKQQQQQPRRLDYCYNIKTVRSHEAHASYDPAMYDLIAVADVKPQCIDDLQAGRSSYVVALVTGCWGGSITVSSPRPIVIDGKRVNLFGVFLMNMTTNLRIWSALEMKNDDVNSPSSMNIIESVILQQPDGAAGEHCKECCASGTGWADAVLNSQALITPHDPNESQRRAILDCVSSSQCTHRNTVRLVWGPPGTGKTKTVGLLLYALLKLKTKTLICAPTNTAVLEVAARVLKLSDQSGVQLGSYGLGDVVVSGNRSRMKIDDGNEAFLDVFLEHRVDVLRSCFNKKFGWVSCMNSMIDLLENSETLYKLYVASETQKQTDEQQSKQVEEKKIKIDLLPYKDFLKKEFDQCSGKLRFCMENLYTHLPTSFIYVEVVKLMIEAVELLETIKQLLSGGSYGNRLKSQLTLKKSGCLPVLKSLLKEFSLPKVEKKLGLRGFCVANALLVFCTASGSASVTRVDTRFDMVVIDEAAQLKECESAIPLQAKGLGHVVLVGDERQLPAMVKSKISDSARFGRSLFERLALLGHKKHLLNIQYRMHPSISRFPNQSFYSKQILNAAQVTWSSHKRDFLGNKMYGSYSFINVTGGEEEFDSTGSSRNIMEIAVIVGIAERLSKACAAAKEKLSVGVISPYKAQTSAIQDMLAKRFPAEGQDGHVSIKVSSVDGFQGGEEDVIIVSSVRCNVRGSIGFLSNPQRTNVALTRARYSLWILGDEHTLLTSKSIWAQVVQDAKEQGSFFDVAQDTELVQSISSTLLDLGRIDLLLGENSVTFKFAKWKMLFTEGFSKSMAQIQDIETQKSVVSLLGKLSTGWREKVKTSRGTRTLVVGGSSTTTKACELLELYKMQSKQLYLAWSIDICCANECWTQVVRIWDVLPVGQLASVAKLLATMTESYTLKILKRCMHKCMDGNVQLPVSWSLSQWISSCDDEVHVTEEDSLPLLSSSLASLNLNGKSDKQRSNNFSLRLWPQ